MLPSFLMPQFHRLDPLQDQLGAGWRMEVARI